MVPEHFLQDRFGEGHLFTPHKVLGLPYGVHHDFSWGMFGRISQARSLLAKKWAGGLHAWLTPPLSLHQHHGLLRPVLTILVTAGAS